MNFVRQPISQKLSTPMLETKMERKGSLWMKCLAIYQNKLKKRVDGVAEWVESPRKKSETSAFDAPLLKNNIFYVTFKQ